MNEIIRTLNCIGHLYRPGPFQFSKLQAKMPDAPNMVKIVKIIDTLVQGVLKCIALLYVYMPKLIIVTTIMNNPVLTTGGTFDLYASHVKKNNNCVKIKLFSKQVTH